MSWQSSIILANRFGQIHLWVVIMSLLLLYLIDGRNGGTMDEGNCNASKTNEFNQKTIEQVHNPNEYRLLRPTIRVKVHDIWLWILWKLVCYNRTLSKRETLSRMLILCAGRPPSSPQQQQQQKSNHASTMYLYIFNQYAHNPKIYNLHGFDGSNSVATIGFVCGCGYTFIF